MNALQLGLALRGIRVRLGPRQSDVAARAALSQVTVSRVERGQTGRLRVDVVSRVAAALEADIGFDLRWRGGDLPRTLNAGHAAMHEVMARRFRRLDGWQLAPVPLGMQAHELLAFSGCAGRKRAWREPARRSASAQTGRNRIYQSGRA